MYDYLIVGAGITGAVIARCIHGWSFGRQKIMVVDRRSHIGGNCYSENIDGLHVCQYGGHIFHTNNEEIWGWVQNYTDWEQYQHKVLVNYNQHIFSFPINLMTLFQLWGTYTPKMAQEALRKARVPIENPANFEEKVLSLVGEQIYQTFFYGYTKKQWGMEPRDLPASLINRIPIRLNFNDNYFNAKYQGVPTYGYTHFIQRLLSTIPVELGVNVQDDPYWYQNYRRIIFTGPIDEFYQYRYGKLGYRSLRFEYEKGLDTGAATMNFTSEDTPYTRIIGHNYFYNNREAYGMYEYPSDSGEPYYPINTDVNQSLYQQYRDIPNEQVVFTGRLGSYKYIDMDQAIGMAWSVARKELKHESVQYQ